MKSRASLPPTAPRLPDPTGVDMTNPDSVRGFLVSLTSSLMTQLQQRPTIGQSQDSRIFSSPNGTTYKVSVTDAGVVQAEPFGSVNTVPVPPV